MTGDLILIRERGDSAYETTRIVNARTQDHKRQQKRREENWTASGQFLTIAINFLIIAFVLFLAVRAINKLQSPPAPKTPEVPADVKLLTEIRDLLAKRS